MQIFNVTFLILTSSVIDITVLVPLHQTTLDNITAKIGNRGKLGGDTEFDNVNSVIQDLVFLSRKIDSR